MTVSASSFRTHFPEFTDTAAYPDATVTFWLGYAVKMLPGDRWGTLLDLGIELFIAHNLVLGKQSAVRPGSVTGPMNSKSVGALSAGYDTGAVTFEDAGHWNATAFGSRFYQLARTMGAGGMQL